LESGALLTAALLVLVPGIGASLALHRPGEAPIPTRLALCFGLGYATVALSALVLQAAHLLSAASFVALTGGVTVAIWAVALRRSGITAQGRELAAELRRERWLLGAGLLALVVFALVRLRFTPLIDFSMDGPWRYWADGLEIARSGHVPASSSQWGVAYTPTSSKIIVNSYHAGASYLLGSAPLPAMGALLWVASLGLAASLWALAWELGLRLGGALLAPLALVLIDNELHRDLDGYTAEDVGRMAAVCALVLGLRSLRDGRWPERVAAGLLLGCAAGSNGIPAFVAVIALGWYAVALALRGRSIVRLAVSLLAAVAIAGLLYGAALGLSGGDVGLQGAGGGDRYASFGPRLDPTASLAHAAPVNRPSDGDHWYVAPGQLARGLIESATARSLSSGGAWLAGIAILAVALAGALRLPDPLRAIPLMSVAVAATLLSAALLFSYRASTYIPGSFGPRRLYDYACLLLVLVVMAWGEWLAGLLGRVRAWLPAALAVALVVAVSATAAYAGGPARRGSVQNGRRAVAVTDWVAGHLPCGARLLPDRMTLGTFAATTGRVSVVEGMDPYLRPDELHSVLRTVLAAHAFFLQPAKHRAFLADQAVDYVLLVKDVRIGNAVGAIDAGVDPAGFRDLPFLQLVHSDETMDVYRVRGAVAPPVGSSPSALDCRTA
jgi:hypothetical protein